MKFTILSVILLLTLGLAVYHHVRKGYKQGLTRSAMRLGAFLAATLFASLLAVWLAYPLTSLIFNAKEIAQDLSLELNGILLSAGLVKSVLRLGVSVVLYLPLVYGINSLLCLIFRRCYASAMKNRALDQSPYLSENAPYYERKQNVIGACIGGATALLMFIVSLTPMIGLINTTKQAMEIIIQYVETEDAVEDATAYVSFFSDDAMLNAASACGGETLFTMTARTRYQKKNFTLYGEISALKQVDVKKVLRSIEGLEFTDSEGAETVFGILEEVEKSVVLKSFFVSLMSSAARTWASGEEFLEMDKPRFANNVYVEKFVDEVLFICSSTNEKTVRADVTTLVNLYQIFAENAQLFQTSDFEVMMQGIMERGMEEEIRQEIEKNPHMHALLPALEELVVSLLSNEVTAGLNFTEEQRQDIFESISDLLNETLGMDNEIRVEEFVSEISSAMDESGLYLPENLGEIVGEKMVEFFPEYKYVTPQDIEAFFYEYVGQVG